MEALLIQLLSATAWEMPCPEPFGLFHFLTLLLGLPCCWLAARRLARRPIQGDAVAVGVGLLLAGSEVYKQLFRFYLLDGGVYDWSIFPFQLCSVPMYLCLLLPMLGGRVKQVVYDFMYTYNLLGGLMALLVPPGLCHPYWTLTLHAFLWHLLLVFLGLYLGMSGRADRSSRGFPRATALFLGLCVVAFSINLMLWEVSEGTANMFYIGPKASSQPVFCIIAGQFGWFAGTAAYIPCVCLGAYLVLRGCEMILPKCKEFVKCAQT